jgi:hypothetical protein
MAEIFTWFDFLRSNFTINPIPKKKGQKTPDFIVQDREGGVFTLEVNCKHYEEKSLIKIKSLN